MEVCKYTEYTETDRMTDANISLANLCDNKKAKKVKMLKTF